MENELGCHSNESLCSRKVYDGLRAFVEARTAVDSKPSILCCGIEVHKQQSHCRVPNHIAEAPVRAIAVLIRPGNLIGPRYANEARQAAFHRAIDTAFPRRREEEEACCVNHFAIGVVECAVHAMLLETVGHSMVLIALLQLALPS
jgi:hypothetical protein